MARHIHASVRWTALAIVVSLLSGCAANATYPLSDHFDGQRFSNTVPAQKGARDIMRMIWESRTQAAEWPAWIDVTPRLIPEQRVDGGISVTFVNHATFLIQVAGLNILTDPVWSERVSPVTFAGPKRVHQPGVRLADLPPIDVILISHNHYDHLDAPALRELATRDGGPPVVLAGLGNGPLLQDLGFANAVELDWEESHRVGDAELIFTECRHRSGRGLTDQMQTLWGSFVVRTPEGRVYFAGDTGYGPHFAETGARHGPFDLALLPIGAYEPRWFMADIHTNPAEAVQAHLDLSSRQSIGMHFGTFQLTWEGIDEPVEELGRALGDAGVDADEFWVLAPGETRRVDSTGGVTGDPLARLPTPVVRTLY